jgi:hypothetical protein
MGTLGSGDARNAYSGPDRRRHRVFVTKNSEYHCRDNVCVAVRSVRTGAFDRNHVALGRWLSGAIKFTKDGSISGMSDASDARRGEQLCFASGSMDDTNDVLTSPLEAIARPPKDVVSLYPS